MIRIGIDGGNKELDTETLRLLLYYCGRAALDAGYRNLYGSAEERRGRDVEIVCAAGRAPDERYNILIVNDYNESVKPCIKAQAHDDILLLNADAKELCGLLSESGAVVITYGYNCKASVTASSVTENEMQLCIQRGLPAFWGDVLEQQEFSVPYPPDTKNIYSVLSAVSAISIIVPNKLY